MAELLHWRYATSDIREASEVTERIYHRSRLSSSDDGFAMRQELDGDTEVNVARFRYRGGLEAHGRLRSAVAVIASPRGLHEWEVAGRRGTGAELMLMQPGQVVHGRVRDAELVVANLDHAALEERARTVYGDETLRLRAAEPRAVSRDLERMLAFVIEQTRTLLANPVLAEHTLIRASAQRRLAITALETFALAGDPVDRRESWASQRRTFRVAAEYLREHAGLAVTVDDAARRAGVGAPALARAFRAHADCTPGEYLERVRLAGAHDDLVAADPAATTPDAIARRWGFASPTAFAERYLATFGVTPAATLRS